jgi:hypothetical protein
MTTAAPTAQTPQADPKALAAQRRAEAVDLLAGAALAEQVARMRPDGDGVLATLPLLSTEQADYFLGGLRGQPGWALEKWLIDDDGEVRMAPAAEYAAARPEHRFSNNFCLRSVSADASSYPIRALISAAESPRVAAAMSEAYGRPVRLRGIDMARYEDGHHLRRHADVFEDRVFGLIFFLAPGWTPGCGGELVVEDTAGNAHVAGPVQGTVALLRIRPGYHHQVCQVRSGSWTRYVLSTHFAVDTAADTAPDTED